jgi:hypothetical protein
MGACAGRYRAPVRAHHVQHTPAGTHPTLHHGRRLPQMAPSLAQRRQVCRLRAYHGRRRRCGMSKTSPRSGRCRTPGTGVYRECAVACRGRSAACSLGGADERWRADRGGGVQTCAGVQMAGGMRMARGACRERGVRMWMARDGQDAGTVASGDNGSGGQFCVSDFPRNNVNCCNYCEHLNHTSSGGAGRQYSSRSFVSTTKALFVGQFKTYVGNGTAGFVCRRLLATESRVARYAGL